MIARTRALAAAAALSVSLALVAGCGASGGGDDADKTTTTATNGTTTTAADEPTGEDNGIADLSADEIVTKAQDAMRDAGSVTLTGKITEDGQDLAIDMTIGEGGATGTIGVDGQEVQLIVGTDTVYMKGDEAFYENIAGGSAAASKLLGGKWLSVDADSPQAESFTSFADFDGFVDSFLDPDGDVKKGDTGDIDGTPAIAVVDDDDEPAELWVATVGEPYPLQINKVDSEGEKVTLTEHGEEVDVTPPPSDEVISLEDLKSAGGNDSGD